MWRNRYLSNVTSSAFLLLELTIALGMLFVFTAAILGLQRNLIESNELSIGRLHALRVATNAVEQGFAQQAALKNDKRSSMYNIIVEEQQLHNESLPVHLNGRLSNQLRCEVLQRKVCEVSVQSLVRAKKPPVLVIPCANNLE